MRIWYYWHALGLQMTMLNEILAALTPALFLLSIVKQDMPPNSRPSDRQKAGYLGPVHKVSTETEVLSRKLYRESSNGQKELIEDTTSHFGNRRFLNAEQEFDENGKLVADASSDREGEQGPFRILYRYNANGRLSDEDHFNRDGTPVGKNHYVYDSAGKKSEELFYAASGVLLSRALYDEHQNLTDLESFGPDGSVVQVPNAPQQFKPLYTYDDSGQLIKENIAGMEKTYDSKGRISEELFGKTRITYSYDEQGRETERLVDEPSGEYSLSGGNARYVRKYDSHGNEKEQIVFKRDGGVSMRYEYTYEYDSHGNWTKRVEDEKVFNFREDIKPSTLEILSAKYRTISYH